MNGLKLAAITSVIWGAILPLLLPLIINVGPVRTITSSTEVAQEISYSSLASYEALIQFHGLGGLLFIWLKFFIVFTFVFFIVCRTQTWITSIGSD
jgi:hypothetical protein